MEYDSESSCKGGCRSRDFAKTGNNDDDDDDEQARLMDARERCDRPSCSRSPPTFAAEPTFKPRTNPANKRLSAQVMEYYRKYSRDAELDRYFSLPVSNTPQETVNYFYSVYELSARLGPNKEDCVGEDYNLKSYIPRERRRWVRPPLIGQSSNADASSRYVETLTDLQTPSPDFNKRELTPETIHEDKNESHEKLSDANDRKLSSPTSSVASHKPLEWDSGADVGYFNLLSHNKQDEKRLSTIERMALARGCSAALRLDPEGTTESGMQSGKNAGIQGSAKSSIAPDANSTPLVANASGSESEIEITPIVKNHLPGIITGDDIKSQERCVANGVAESKITLKSAKQEGHDFDTPTSTFKTPLLKYSTAERKIANSKRKEITRPSSSPLQKSSSMNVIPASSLKSSLKRSQSELNLRAKERKSVLPLIFNSTSSIATVVNKPATCDKVIQTSPDVCSQESVAVQVSDLDESKPSLTIKKDPNLLTTIHSILKKSNDTYKVKSTRKCENDSRPMDDAEVGASAKDAQRHRSSSDISQNPSTSITPQPDEAENVSGRANSFEYFPGHTYANIPNGRDSRVSSDTGRSNSTLPNSSSSINDKLWGDSDSLVRDLERSVNILKSLVDTNKCDKQVKKRLIQHVIKRLVTAKYTDDKIEHNLEDNVPWNPDDARNKVYRAELLQALTNKHSTTESSDDWINVRKKDTSLQKSAGTTSDVIKEVALGSSNSDKFDRHTDRTEMDGRKARLGLRTDDCQRSSNTDPDKSESSECFVPQRNHKNAKANDIFCLKENCKLPHRESTTTNSILPDHNRILLDAIVNNRRALVESNNNTDNNTDWRLPTTSSERHFELKKYSMSESGDSKLVNYAEMEKRNQLIWITNEISHLCNLKKLLEQPRRLERPKSSPRKSKSANLKSKQTAILRREQCENAGSISDLREDSMNEPWSSHCNLATREAADDTMIQRTVKRNSCTQTSTNLAGAHSRIGGEIVSASRTPRTSATKRIAVGVQTLPRKMSSTPIDSSIGSDTRYPSSPKPKCYQNARCRDQSCQTHNAVRNTCARCSRNPDSDAASIELRKEDGPIVSQQTQTTCTSDDGTTETVYHRASQNNIVQQKQKEAKNQINASKSKCNCVCNGVCSSVNDNKCDSNVLEVKRFTEKRPLFTCALCSEPRPVADAVYNYDVCQKNPSCARESISSSNNQTLGTRANNMCECDINVPVKDTDRKIVIGKSHRQNSGLSCNEESDTGKICDCANIAHRNPETTTAGTFCEHCQPSNGKIDKMCRFAEHQKQIYSDGSQDPGIIQQRKVQNSVLKCNCEASCSCSNNQLIKDTVKACKNFSSKTNVADSIVKTERNCQHCRACGAAYQNIRKCGCHQMYPKAVAYEVSFTKENTSKNETSDIVPIMPKFLKQSSSAPKFDAAYSCDIVKRNSKNIHRTSTLQDYLSRNNPEFVDNAETRRQYLSEICQLRELRKEKRIQLLAMASTSTVNKFLPIRKPTACVQRKITDEEMKERLRKRYLRLNEVRCKRRQQERQEEARRNKLMAKIFCKKLQQKVLRGQVDLSQSVSVISNL